MVKCKSHTRIPAFILSQPTPFIQNTALLQLALFFSGVMFLKQPRSENWKDDLDKIRSFQHDSRLGQRRFELIRLNSMICKVILSYDLLDKYDYLIHL